MLARFWYYWKYWLLICFFLITYWLAGPRKLSSALSYTPCMFCQIGECVSYLSLFATVQEQELLQCLLMWCTHYQSEYVFFIFLCSFSDTAVHWVLSAIIKVGMLVTNYLVWTVAYLFKKKQLSKVPWKACHHGEGRDVMNSSWRLWGAFRCCLMTQRGTLFKVYWRL